MAYFFREIFYETVGTLQRCTFFAVDGPRCMQIFLAHAMTCILAIFMAIFCMHEIGPKKPFSGHIAGFFIDALKILSIRAIRPNEMVRHDHTLKHPKCNYIFVQFLRLKSILDLRNYF